MSTPPEAGVHNSARVRRVTLALGLLQAILGLALTALSFITFSITEVDRLRKSCPYWAGIVVCFSGAVGIIAWKRSSALSVGMFTLISSVCVILQMIGAIFAADMGSSLKSVVSCDFQAPDICSCCDSYPLCEQGAQVFRFEGMTDCSIIWGILKELVYSLFVLNIFGSLLCFTATVLGCTTVIQCISRDQIHFRRHNSERSTTVTEDPASWQAYPRDLDMAITYAPPVYRSMEYLQEYGTTDYIVPPPVFDPTDLPPPYSNGNPSFSNSNCSLGCQDCASSQCNRQQSCPVYRSTHNSSFNPPSTQDKELRAQLSLLNNCSGSCSKSVCTQPQQEHCPREAVERKSCPHAHTQLAVKEWSGNDHQTVNSGEISRKDQLAPGCSMEEANRTQEQTRRISADGALRTALSSCRETTV